MKREIPFKTRVLNLFRLILKNAFFEKRLAKLSAGKSPSSFIGKLLPSCYLYPKGSIRNVTRNGIRLQLDISDLVDWTIYFNLIDDSHNSLFKLCKEDSVVLDIGTNNGFVLLNFCRIAKQGIVYGFEVDPVNYQRCQKNLSLNPFQNYVVSNVGLGNTETKAVISVLDDHNLGMNKINPLHTTAGREVTITVLDLFAERNNLPKVDLIKIDTEGFELNILMGATKILTSDRPVLFIELDDNNLRQNGHSASALIGYLIEHFGYSIINSVTGAPVNVDTNFKDCHYDIIARKAL